MRVICELENASDEINGVKFHPLEDGGRVSDEISQEQAELFLSIPGYVPFDGEPPAPKQAAPAPKSRKAVKAAPAEEPKQEEPQPDLGAEKSGEDQVF